MRRPTPASVLYDWHRRALAGERPPVLEDEPQCGWFRLRLVRLGPWCPARIWMEQEIDPETGELCADETLRAEVLGQPRDPRRLWLSVAGKPIDEGDYHRLMHTRLHGPMHERATHRAVDFSETPVRP